MQFFSKKKLPRKLVPAKISTIKVIHPENTLIKKRGIRKENFFQMHFIDLCHIKHKKQFAEVKKH